MNSKRELKYRKLFDLLIPHFFLTRHTSLYRILFRTLNHQYDYTFDWTMLKQRSMQQTGSTSAITHGTAENRDEREKTTEGELKSVK